MSALCWAYSTHGFLTRTYSSFKLIRDGTEFAGKRRKWKGGADGLKEHRVRQEKVKEALQFWVLFALLTLHEIYFEFLVSWVPLYFYVKLVLLWYIVNPGTRGAAVVFEFFEPKLVQKVNWVESRLAPTIDLWVRGAVDLIESVLNRSLRSISDESLRDFSRRLAQCQEAVELERQRRLLGPLGPLTGSSNPADGVVRTVSITNDDDTLVEMDADEARGFVVVSPLPPAAPSPLLTAASSGDNNKMSTTPGSFSSSLQSPKPVSLTEPLFWGGGAEASQPPPRPARRTPPAPSPFSSVPTNPSFLPTRGVVVSPPWRNQHEESATDRMLDDLLKSPDSQARKRAPAAVEEIRSPTPYRPPRQNKVAVEVDLNEEEKPGGGENLVTSFFSGKRLSWTPRWPFANAADFVAPSPISPASAAALDKPPTGGAVAGSTSPFPRNYDSDSGDEIPSPTGPVTRSRARRRARQ